MYAVNGILFNHESPRRGETFVTRKITRAATRIKEGLQDKLFLGNLDAKRDWGFAGDYVQAMWLMLQQDKPDDYVVATNQTKSVREFLDVVFTHLKLDWKKYVQVDPRYFRPAEVDLLLGDAGKAKRDLGWTPTVTFEQLAIMMTDQDWKLARQEKIAPGARMSLSKTDRIIITGGGGFVGSFIVEKLASMGYSNVVPLRKKDFDLTREAQVDHLYQSHKPDIILHLAAEVGGIGANRDNPGRFFLCQPCDGDASHRGRAEIRAEKIRPDWHHLRVSESHARSIQ